MAETSSAKLTTSKFNEVVKLLSIRQCCEDGNFHIIVKNEVRHLAGMICRLFEDKKYNLYDDKEKIAEITINKDNRITSWGDCKKGTDMVKCNHTGVCWNKVCLHRKPHSPLVTYDEPCVEDHFICPSVNVKVRCVAQKP